MGVTKEEGEVMKSAYLKFGSKWGLISFTAAGAMMFYYVMAFFYQQQMQGIHQMQGVHLINIVRPQGLIDHTWHPQASMLILCAGGLLGLVISFVRRTYAATKRCMDIIGSILALVLLSPFFLLAFILINVSSPGPVVFKQRRLGKNGQPFDIYKFRTMKLDAEKDTGPVWALQNDHRLIWGGRFLRRTHIDEIPQFINVLKGQMSIIGPRPERPFFIQKFKGEIADYEKRLSVKPGITGLAQVKHRYDQTIRDVKIKVKYDLLYIKKMCLLTDLRVIYWTVLVVLNAL